MRIVEHRGKWSASVQGRRFSTGYPAEPKYRGAAEQEAGKIVKRLKQPSTNLVADIMSAYLSDAEERNIHVDRQRYAWKALEPFFGQMTPDQIDRPASRKYAASRNVSDGTINRELRTLRAALRWNDKNTPAVIELRSEPEPRDRWLTKSEFMHLLDATDSFHMTVFLHLAIATAARKEAILSLTWLQVRDNEIWLGRKPNGKNRATVPITDTLRSVLDQAREVALTDYVVEYAGRPVKDVKKGFNAAVKRSGIEHCTIHDIRHTSAVWMAGAGIPLEEIAAYLGHTDIRVTQRVYARYQPDHLRRAASALEL